MTLIILCSVVVAAALITAALIWADQRPEQGEIRRRRFNELDGAEIIAALKKGLQCNNK